MPKGFDPDDVINKNGVDYFLNFLKEKQIIHSFIWEYNLNKIDQNNPFEISNFEKDIKKLTYLIKDETLKKYVMEEFGKNEKIDAFTNISRSFKSSKLKWKKIQNS